MTANSQLNVAVISPLPLAKPYIIVKDDEEKVLGSHFQQTTKYRNNCFASKFNIKPGVIQLVEAMSQKLEKAKMESFRLTLKLKEAEAENFYLRHTLGLVFDNLCESSTEDLSFSETLLDHTEDEYKDESDLKRLTHQLLLELVELVKEPSTSGSTRVCAENSMRRVARILGRTTSLPETRGFYHRERNGDPCDDTRNCLIANCRENYSSGVLERNTLLKKIESPNDKETAVVAYNHVEPCIDSNSSDRTRNEVLVRRSFADDLIALTGELDDFSHKEEKKEEGDFEFMAVDTLVQACTVLVYEREDYLRETLKLVQKARDDAAANVALVMASMHRTQDIVLHQY